MAPSNELIDNDASLRDLVATAQEHQWIGVDTEADSLYSYPERLCLMQLGFVESNELVDPLSGLGLSPLLEVLKTKTLVFHGGDFDLRLLRKTQGFVPSRVFDTMIAARLLGERSFGLAHLAARFCGATLHKGLQKANWARRPLTREMLAYARGDTAHLLDLRELLTEKLTKLRRLQWHEQCCARLLETCAQPMESDPDTEFRLKGADKLTPLGLNVLRALWHWREEEAKRANRPPFFVVAHKTLVEIADRAAKGTRIHLPLPRRLAPSKRKRLLRAIDGALQSPEETWPGPKKRKGRPTTPKEADRSKALAARRDLCAESLDIEPPLIASKAVIEALARDWDEHQHKLLPWQRDLLK